MESRFNFSAIGGMVVALVVLGAVFAIVWLLSSEKGRAVAKVLVGVLAVVLFLGFFALMGIRFRSSEPLRQTAHVDPDRLMVRPEGPRSEGETTETLAEASPTSEAEGPWAVWNPLGTIPDRKSSPTSEAEGQPTTAESGRSPATDNTAEEALTMAVAADRPDWVEAAPGKVGAAYQMTVKVGPYETRVECDGELPSQLHAAVDRYATAYLRHDTDGRVRLPLDYLQSEIVKAEWEEPTKVLITPKEKLPEYVPMIVLHVLLEFDHEANARIQDQWDNVIVNQRLLGVGGLTAAVLLLLSAAYGYLKIDLATSGKYRGRLRLAAAGLILLVLVAGFAFAADSGIIGDPF